ncbi:MAG: sodium:proton antiporter [Verrucomicrobiae bacterium]|nr:sodium:proton antiporter [Verrucomicrobiae bacterium]
MAAEPQDVSLWWGLPFGFLLASIALLPLLAARWWERYYMWLAGGLGAVVLAYYAFGLRDFPTISGTAHEYLSFIALVGSLFIVSGGIAIRTRGQATPIQNVMALGVGALLANLFGTAGASMLLIRPFLRMNQYRLTTYHVIFFIFIISNVGGCLTPIGDPPLFLGYLEGIPFLWVAAHLWKIWGFGVGYLLILFFLIDRRNFRRAATEIRRIETPLKGVRFEGSMNFVFVAIILAAVFIEHPAFLREALMTGAAAGSYFWTRKNCGDVYRTNEFSFHPLREVAMLFAGIFATMMPVLAWLELHARQIGLETPGSFYWASGFLSSVLDNAPTYLNFLTASIGLLVDPAHVHQVQNWVAAGQGAPVRDFPAAVQNTITALQAYHPDMVRAHAVPLVDVQICYLLGNLQLNRYIMAVSVGAVFFGAATYIGNAPNFMVKSIAAHHKIHMTSFFGYVLKYSVPILGPLFVMVWWLFFRG